MTLVPLKNKKNLEILSCKNWCKQNIGEFSATTWFIVNIEYPTKLDNFVLIREVKKLGLETSIVFYNDEDAIAFKLKFGL